MSLLIAVLVYLTASTLASAIRQRHKLTTQNKSLQERARMTAIYVMLVAPGKMTVSDEDQTPSDPRDRIIKAFGQDAWDAFVEYDDGKLYRSACGVHSAAIFAASFVGAMRTGRSWREQGRGVQLRSLLTHATQVYQTYSEQGYSAIGEDPIAQALAELDLRMGALNVAVHGHGQQPETDERLEQDVARDIQIGMQPAPGPRPRRGRARAVR